MSRPARIDIPPHVEGELRVNPTAADREAPDGHGHFRTPTVRLGGIGYGNLSDGIVFRTVMRECRRPDRSDRKRSDSEGSQLSRSSRFNRGCRLDYGKGSAGGVGTLNVIPHGTK